jgi:hypothetical protein
MERSPFQAPQASPYQNAREQGRAAAEYNRTAYLRNQQADWSYSRPAGGGMERSLFQAPQASPYQNAREQGRAAAEYNRTAYLRNQQADRQEINAAKNRFPGVGESQIRLLIQSTRKAQKATAKADYRAAMKANSDAQQQALWADPAYSARWGAERARKQAYSDYAQQKFGGMTPGFMQGDRYSQGWGSY